MLAKCMPILGPMGHKSNETGGCNCVKALANLQAKPHGKQLASSGDSTVSTPCSQLHTLAIPLEAWTAWIGLGLPSAHPDCPLLACIWRCDLKPSIWCSGDPRV